MSTFWSWYITLLTVGSLVALFWLLFATRKGERKNTTDQTMGHLRLHLRVVLKFCNHMNFDF